MDRSYISLEHLENHAASPRYAPEGAVSPAAAYKSFAVREAEGES